MNNRIMAMLFALVAAMFISIVPVKAEAAGACATHNAKDLKWNHDVGKHWQVCQKCGETTVAQASHNDLVYSKKDAATHTVKCRTCGYTGSANHVPVKDGTYCRCEKCGVIIDHTLVWNKSGTDNHKQECSVCDYETALAPHNWVATDNENGTHTKVCGTCGKSVTEAHGDVTTDKDCACDACGAANVNHSPVEVAGKNATCTEDGVSGHLKCEFCGKLFSKSIPGKELTEADVVVDALGHKAYTTWLKTEDGKGHYHMCQNEGCEEKLEYAEHEMEWKYDSGMYHWEQCKVCGKTNEAVKHSFVFEANLGERTHNRVCSVCGKKEEAVSCNDADGDHKCDDCKQTMPHIYSMSYMGEEIHRKTTCTVDGLKTHKVCQVCGLMLNAEGKVVTLADVTNPATGHKFKEGLKWRETEDGTGHYKICGNDGCDAHVYGTVENVKTGEETHTHGSWYKNTTGQHCEVCAVCGNGYNDGNHDYSIITRTDVLSGANKKQQHIKTCVCGDVTYEECTFDDNCVCTVCGADKNHEWAALKGLDAVKATCTTTGKKYAGQCRTCGKIYLNEGGKLVLTTEQGRVIPALGHKWEPNGVLDEVEGRHIMKCVNEGCTKGTVLDHYTKDGDCFCDVKGCNVIAHSHTFIQVVGKAATCTEDGVEAYNKYAGCGRMFDLNNNEITEPVTIPATGHTASEKWVPGENGVHVKTCITCGEIVASEAHNFQNRSVTCSICGAEEGLTHVAAKAATCTETGNVEYWYSKITGKMYADEAGTRQLTSITVAATGHDLSGWQDAGDGQNHEQICQNDGCSYKETLAHNRANGCFCTDCGAEIGEHTLTMVEMMPATCAKAGHQAYFECSCGELYDMGLNKIDAPVAIAQLKHDMSSKVKEDAKEGKHYIQCKNCSYRMYEEHGMVLSDPLKGNYHQWLCECGELEIETHYDKNGDKKCDVCGHSSESQSVVVENHDNQYVQTGDKDTVKPTKSWWQNWLESLTPSNSGGTSSTAKPAANNGSASTSAPAASSSNTTASSGNTTASSGNTTASSGNTTTTPSGSTSASSGNATASQGNAIMQFINWLFGLFGF